MRHGLVGGHVSQLGSGAAAERSATGGEHEPANLVSTPAHEALGQGGVLGVDGDDLPRRSRAVTSGPPMISDSLLARARL